MATGFLYDTRFLEHDTGRGYPECPARLSASFDFLSGLPWFSTLKKIFPKTAEEEWLRLIHSAEYLRRADETCREGVSYLDTPDVGISENSFEIAKLAAGGAIELADRIASGEIENAFALLRPPGHHAEESNAMGFCLLNNIAILARYLQRKHGLEKILILDWDVHHGNGTQHTFEDDPSVFYISLHQYPFYPGTGAFSETGTGRGRGATLNCPMPAGKGDEDYRRAFEEIILPAIEKFKPQAVLISAGFDAHAADPLASMNLSTEFYGWMTAQMMEAAHRFAGGRLISLLEGGYNLKVLPACIAVHLAGLSGNTVT